MYDNVYENIYENNPERNDRVTTPPVQTGTRRKQRSLGTRLFAALLCGLLFGAATGAGFTGIRALLPRETAAAETEPNANAQKAAEEQGENPAVGLSTVSYTGGGAALSQTLDVSDIAEGMMPSMVSITNISVQEVQSYFGMFGRQQTQTQELQSSGTGIIIGENEQELLIVTNNHVVEDATTLSVCFVDNEVCEATVKGTDPDNDLAVIAVKLENIKADTAEAIKIAKIGNSDELKVGQQVVAIGNALGYGQSVTTGIVSALGRQIDTTDAIMIQTDAAINPGNSGGALLNMKGEVIGINSAKFSSTEVEGMGYAISINEAMPILADLMNRTTREKVSEENASYLGITGEDITSAISSAYGVPQGIYITSLDQDSPLRDAGITVKSIITHFDGIRVTSYSNLENRLNYYAAGETVEVTVQVMEGKEYVERTVEITLGRASEHSAASYPGGFGPGRGRP
ncbi:MAG: trypsin-like peptidase domain-containing protein [Oscillospiraceae bacterium]|nr:trypsin-like peptidase domain-containing protein [Oscillospiraceae bacterium]